jgi:hypothetical protein
MFRVEVANNYLGKYGVVEEVAASKNDSTPIVLNYRDRTPKYPNFRLSHHQ